MYVLNNKQILNCVQDENLKRVYLSIGNFLEKQLEHTFYYFRLGRQYEVMDEKDHPQILRLSEQERTFTLKAGDYAVVNSHERFTLSSRVMAIFGPSSDVVNWRLQLIHGPFVDPLFDAHLRLGILNLGKEEATLTLGQRIGKIMFFDISDTYPVEKLKRGSAAQRKFEERKRLRDDDPVPSWVEEENPEFPEGSF